MPRPFQTRHWASALFAMGIPRALGLRNGVSPYPRSIGVLSKDQTATAPLGMVRSMRCFCDTSTQPPPHPEATSSVCRAARPQVHRGTADKLIVVTIDCPRLVKPKARSDPSPVARRRCLKGLQQTWRQCTKGFYCRRAVQPTIPMW